MTTTATTIGSTQVDDSLWDIDVVSRNVEAFRLLAHQPPSAVKAFATASLRNESRGVLRHRHEQFRAAAMRQFLKIPPLAPHAEQWAARWADRRFERDSLSLRLLLRLGGGVDVRDVVAIDSRARELLAEAMTGAQAPLLVGAHCGAYQALPPVLAALGRAPAFLMDGGAQSVAAASYRALVPELGGQLAPVAAQQQGVGRQLIGHLKSGRPTLIFPEFAFDTAGYATTSFFGRTVFTPPGVEAVSRIARVTVFPVRLLPENAYFRLVVDEPLWLPGQQVARGEVTAAVFSWLGDVVAADPADWWCWEIFEQFMAADRIDRTACVAQPAPTG